MRRAVGRQGFGGGLEEDPLDEEPASRDLVLGAPALVGIFFALAVVCAICFGFGYSSAHGWRKPGVSAVPAPVPVPALIEDGRRALTHPIPLGGSGADNSASDQPAAESPTAAKLSPGAEATQSAAPSEEAGFPPNYIVPDAARPPVDEPPQAGIQADGANLMVQIAAVSRAADAETLASALRHDGFAAMVRTSTTDSYFHVQVGPFATLAAAKVMRTRLADGGYNAFIKP